MLQLYSRPYNNLTKAMKHRILAQEELNDEVQVEQPEDQMVSIQPDYERIAEGQEIENTLGNLEAQVTPDATAAQLETVETALEHFKHRLGDGSLRRVATENLGAKRSSTETMADIKRLRNNLRKSLNKSMEGFFSNLKNGFQRSFTSKQTMYERSLSYLQTIAQNSREPINVDHESWANVFTEFVGQNLNGTNIMRVMDDLATRSEKLNKILTKAVQILEQTKAISKQSDGSSDAEHRVAVEIYKFSLEVDEVARDVAEYLAKGVTARKTIETLASSQAREFEGSLRAMVSNVDTVLNSFYVKFNDLVGEAGYDVNDDVTFTVNGDSELEYESKPKAGHMALDYLAKRLYSQLSWIGAAFNSRYDRTLWGAMKYLEVSASR